MLWRVRFASFAAGFASAAALAMYMLQKDVQTSHRILADQAARYHTALEERISRLENLTANLSSPDSQTSPIDQVA
ncbi:hypothetical protein O6H91_11G079600 [Diphasiastrum complanatum]|uniref:Uncharacterized protein n=1 Tax=Diphasiastrum complanatum TaxID=34168 RepID=A0ACC2CAY4_DIPCM|nr:hypothetical protein O6H91_Y071600 [Diphasiastrum complanatum]KAJ7539176.1 hypothetical protein O6H91_11G079600 [Diphasiastrum complanatum]